MKEVQPFSEIVRLSQIMLRAFHDNSPKIHEPLRFFVKGKWRKVDPPDKWFGTEQWAAADYKEKLGVIQCELVKKMRRWYNITDVPDEFK